MKNILKCFYDFSVYPSSYDFLTFLTCAEITRKRRKMEFLSIHFLKGPNLGFRLDNKNITFEENNIFFHNVILPSLHLLPSIKEFNWVDKKNLTLHYFDPYEIFPRGFDPKQPILGHSCVTGMDLVACRLRMDESCWYKSPLYAKNFVENYVSSRFNNSKIITITSRESDHYDKNNSRKLDKKNFKKFFQIVKDKGFQPLILRETENAFDNKSLFEDIPEMPLASLHLPFRVALYEKSFFNIFTINGPATIAMFGLNNSCHLFKFDKDDSVISPEFYIKRFGMIEGSSIPMTSKSSYFLWNTQNYNEILKIMDNMSNDFNINKELNSFSNKKNLELSINVSIAYLLNELCTGYIFEEDISLLKNIYSLYKEKIIEVNPFEYIRSIEKRFCYGNKILPQNITDKLYSNFKKTFNNYSVA